MTSSLTFPHATSPVPGVTVSVAPGVEWLCMPLPFALNHINLWLVADRDGNGDGFAAIDTGYTQDVVKQAWRAILTSHRLTRCIVTHYHPDHLGLAAWLEQETGARLWMAQGEFINAHLVAGQVAAFSTAAMLAFFRQHGLDEERIAALEQRGNSYRAGVPAIPASYTRLFAGQTLAIGPHGWRTMVGYGHAPEHMSLYCDDLHVLISGDMLLPRISTNVAVWAANPLDNPLKWFLDSIDSFRSLPEDTLVLPSHGRPFRGLHARVDQLHAHHAGRFRLLIDTCRDRPYSAAELIPVLFDRPIPDPHQTMFAMGEAIAHLNYLEHAGQMTRTDEGGKTRFRTSA